MRFGALNYLGLLGLIPVLIGFYIWAARSKQKAMAKFANHELWGQLIRSVSLPKQRLKPVLIITGILFLVLALIQPKWGYHWEEVKRKGLDIVIALDVSKSMLAEDIKPNRLEAAKREIKSLIHILKGDRIAIVGFAGDAFLHCPLTLDYGTAKLFVDHLDIDSVPLGGTDIGGAIRTAIKAFEGHEKKHRVLILITDGEDHREKVMEAVEAAKKQGIVIFPIGIGKKEGAPIPLVDDQGRKSFVKDREGKVVLSRLDPVLLQKIALMTGGKKGSIGTGSFPLEEIYQTEVSRMERKEMEASRQQRFEHRFQWPLFLGLLCFVLEAVLDERKKVRSLGWWQPS
ncbi:MAG: VWA domain-containing protein [Candidatus Omnitrophica bacterium]|nr:VWA domain-containing protein [Candidatus Omnitrophota bacterium]